MRTKDDLEVRLADVRLQQAGVTISTTGRHWLLPHRLASVIFKHTEVPWFLMKYSSGLYSRYTSHQAKVLYV